MVPSPKVSTALMAVAALPALPSTVTTRVAVGVARVRVPVSLLLVRRNELKPL